MFAHPCAGGNWRCWVVAVAARMKLLGRDKAVLAVSTGRECEFESDGDDEKSVKKSLHASLVAVWAPARSCDRSSGPMIKYPV